MIDPNEKKKGLNNFARYSSISFQMIVVIGVFAFIGYKIDAYRRAKTPIFTAALSLLGVGVAMYQVVKQLNKNEP
ncbi:MAG: AtpZ/AtpI family protein [Candidatus Pedobacter colombiensis]|uniref:AtpZ/AtpI family protein n=1 Tax=Candidatus Pedobacter colombiensis TaxID=3121371 RepID=A0AAJ6B683_9SPHI|nr:AtpZ/AtpI family protein [Pedobacter sp.]WEK18960.1 MAG: AtpZ/AtpI family protein [Pedobacter sp.]